MNFEMNTPFRRLDAVEPYKEQDLVSILLASLLTAATVVLKAPDYILLFVRAEEVEAAKALVDSRIPIRIKVEVLPGDFFKASGVTVIRLY